MTSYLSAMVSSACQLSGISDFKKAASHFMNHQWESGTIHALRGATKAALIFGTLYAANQIFSIVSTSESEPSEIKICKDLFAKGFEGRAWFRGKMGQKLNIPPLDPSKYSLFACGYHCIAELTEAGKIFIINQKNFIAWDGIYGNGATLLWR